MFILNQNVKYYMIISIGEILFDVYAKQKRIGGAPFNFIYNIWNLTGNGIFISRIGNDINGNELLEFLKNENFDTSFIQIDEEYPTGTVVVKLDNSKTPSFQIKNDTAYDYIEYNKSLSEILFNPKDILYFGTLAQRNKCSRETINNLTNKNCKIFCDINLRNPFYNEQIIKNSLEASNILKLNYNELMLINKFLIHKNNKIELLIDFLLNEYKIELLCLTLGKDGAGLFTKKKKAFYKSEPIEVVDTVGAGDAFASIVCIGYLKGWSLEKIISIASEFAGDICQQEGAIPPNKDIYNYYKDKINE